MNSLLPVVDTLFGKPCLAVHVQPHLEAQAQAGLRALQQAAVAHWAGAFHEAPPHAFHVTIYPLVPTTEGFDKETYWSRIAEPSLRLVEELCAGAPPLDLRFHGLKVTPVGIIAVADDASGLIDRIRRRILETVPPPPGLEHRHYDLVHTTLARFAEARPMPEEVVRRIEAGPVDLPVRVARLKIFRETIFPCLVGEELAGFPLGPQLQGGSHRA
ncbi:2'-5' RNA ligase family protein [Microvirga subterranea]|uniref:2'-5' RNA ligase superfamily protein n=1 Tax=Microvirga subterranea TaxID=186651 RepID=A0A370HKX3_9HYPH|nr:2'-5' RNA ligase family protein [Microvirga subterranea]RDI59246.1 2'-5' RNA ligase superfamily protein [Microvirga subterranea]